MNTIEFMGLPGAGKTTLASALLRLLIDRGVPALSQAEVVELCTRRRNDGILINILKRLPTVFWEPFAGIQKALPEMHRFSSRHVPLLHLITTTLDQKPFPQLWSQSILYTFYRQFAEYQLADEHLRPNELRVVEEGLIHRGFTLFGYLSEEASIDELLRYIDVIPLPLIAVFVDVSPEECCERLQKRPEPPIPLQKRKTSEVIDQLMVGRRCLQNLVVVSEQRNVRVFRIANSLDETTTAEYRLHEVLDYLNASVKY